MVSETRDETLSDADEAIIVATGVATPREVRGLIGTLRALRAKVEELEQSKRVILKAGDELDHRLQESESRCEALREALRKHGGHSSLCATWKMKPKPSFAAAEHPICDCGLRAALGESE